MSKFYGFDLDSDFEEIWHELESVQDGVCCHRIAIEATSKEDVAEILSSRLKEFFSKNMYESDNCGYEVN
jgi:hypothetical protein